MGLFTAAEFKTRTFHAPVTPSEFLRVLFDGQYPSLYDEWPWPEKARIYADAVRSGQDPSIPPLTEAIYIERADSSGLSLKAGNRAKTYWTLNMSLSGQNPVKGEITYERFDSKWQGSLLRLNADLGFAISAMGGKTLKWP